MTEPSIRRAVLMVLREHRRRLATFAAWSLLEAVPAALSGYLVAQAVDDGFLAGRAGPGFGWLAALGVAVLIGAFATRQTYVLLAGVVEPFRDDLAGIAVAGTVRSFARRSAPPDRSGVARLTHQVDVVRDTSASLIMTAQGFVVVTAGALVGLATLDPAALVLVVPPLLLGLAVFAGTLPGLAARQRDVLLAEEQIAAMTHTLSSGMRDIVACGAEDRLAAAVGRKVEAHAAAAAALAKRETTATVVLGIGGRVPLVLVLVGAPWLLEHGATAGVVLGALTYVAQGVQPALQMLVGAVSGSAVTLLVTWRRLLEAAAAGGGADPQATDGTADDAPGTRTGRGDLELREVSFAYGRAADPVLHDLSLRVPDGDHLVVVGPSGAGKSTLAGLLAGILRPDAGAVLLDGLPLSRWDPPHLVRRRVLIPQEAYVFAGTLRENLAYLDPSVDDAVLEEAIEMLGLAPLVDRLGGHGTPIVPDELSAGERQLITLVRAYVSPAPLIILDEATCHLDPSAEARVELAFAARPGTLVVIAHRISSAQRARRVLVLDGATAALGKHVELQTVSTSYRELLGHWTPGTPSVPTR